MRIEILILATLLAATTAFFIKPRRNEIKSMSSKRRPEARVIGGEEAPINGFPYHVALYSVYKEFLSGALITDRWVITTGLVATDLPGNGFALLGAHEPNITEVTQQRIEIDMKIIHESYDIDQDYVYINNIALLRLKTAAKLNRFVSTITLAAFNSPDFDGARLRLTSFGGTESGTTQSKSLRYVVVDGISNSVCETMRADLNDGNLCVKTTGGKGGCWNEYGGPLMDVDRGLLVGLSGLHGACDIPSNPDVFTRVSYHNNWIVDNIEINTNIIK